jgi:4-hydroxy-4-methyl-2-oxoglutarate aldolase
MSTTQLDPKATTFPTPERLDPKLIEAARALDAATLHEAAGKIGVLPHAIKPVVPGFKICGTAVPVQAPGGDNLWLHRALYVAQPGDVLVIHVAGQYEHGYWGEVMSTAAKARGLAGMVIDGCVRDVTLLEQIGFPVFARGLCIRGTGKDFAARGWINAPTLFEDVTVHAGDLIVGDADGVVCIPRQQIPTAIAAAQQRAAREAAECELLASGNTSTLAIYGWE